VLQTRTRRVGEKLICNTPLFTTAAGKNEGNNVLCFVGANNGIGKVTAQELSKRGAKVILLCRDLDKAGQAAEEIAKDTGGVVETVKLDLASLK